MLIRPQRYNEPDLRRDSQLLYQNYNSFVDITLHVIPRVMSQAKEVVSFSRVTQRVLRNFSIDEITHL